MATLSNGPSTTSNLCPVTLFQFPHSSSYYQGSPFNLFVNLIFKFPQSPQKLKVSLEQKSNLFFHAVYSALRTVPKANKNYQTFDECIKQ